MNLILVTGPPASGKTAIAVPVAMELGFQLVTKDSIKEHIDAAMGLQQRDSEWSHLLGRATFEVMWTVAPYFENLVLDCNFYPDSREQRDHILTLSPRPLEVYCQCPLDEVTRRYEARADSRHPVHVDKKISREKLAQYNRPLNLGPVLTVDTTQSVDVPSIISWVRAELPRLN